MHAAAAELYLIPHPAFALVIAGIGSRTILDG
jgi:hypothetical protein